MEFANMSGLDALDEIFDTAEARAVVTSVGAASEEPVADVDIASWHQLALQDCGNGSGEFCTRLSRIHFGRVKLQ